MSQLLGTDKDIEKLARAARKAGWIVKIGAANHIRWDGPNKQRFVCGHTPSTGATFLKVRSRLRREGVAV